MRAIQFNTYGAADVLTEVSVDASAPGPDQVRVRVEATSVNAVDVVARAGGYRRLTRAKAPFGTGIDLVGVVDEVGANVTQHARGDRVWGLLGSMFTLPTGTLAEYATLPATAVTPAPTGVTSQQGASALVPATIASIAMEHVPVAPDDTVIVRGAAGGVGSAMVQLAAHRGAHVIGIATHDMADYVTSLGASQVLDFREIDPRDLPLVNGIFDTVGADMLGWRKRLNAGGRMVTTAAAGSLSALGAVSFSVLFGSRRIRGFVGQPSLASIERGSQLVSDRIVTPRIAATFSMTEVVAAHRRFEAGDNLGRLVVSPH